MLNGFLQLLSLFLITCVTWSDSVSFSWSAYVFGFMDICLMVHILFHWSSEYGATSGAFQWNMYGWTCMVKLFCGYLYGYFNTSVSQGTSSGVSVSPGLFILLPLPYLVFVLRGAFQLLPRTLTARTGGRDGRSSVVTSSGVGPVSTAPTNLPVDRKVHHAGASGGVSTGGIGQIADPVDGGGLDRSAGARYGHDWGLHTHNLSQREFGCQPFGVLEALLTDMVIAVMLDLTDTLTIIDLLPAISAIDDPWSAIIAYVVCACTLATWFMHSTAYPTSESDVLITRKTVCMTSIWMCDLPFLSIRLLVWWLAPLYPGLQGMVLKNVIGIPLWLIRLRHCRDLEIDTDNVNEQITHQILTHETQHHANRRFATHRLQGFRSARSKSHTASLLFGVEENHPRHDTGEQSDPLDQLLQQSEEENRPRVKFGDGDTDSELSSRSDDQDAPNERDDDLSPRPDVDTPRPDVDTPRGSEIWGTTPRESTPRDTTLRGRTPRETTPRDRTRGETTLSNMDSLTNIYGGQDLYRIDQSSEESSSKDPERSESKLGSRNRPVRPATRHLVACPHGGHHHENHGDQEQGDQEHGGHKTRRFVRIKSLEPTDTGGRLVHRPLATKSVAFKSPSAHQVAAKPFSRLLLDGDEMDEEAGNRFHPFSDVVRRHSSLFTDESVSELGSPGPVSSGYRELPAPTKERNFIQRIFHRWFTFKSSVGEVDPAEDYLTGFRTLPIPSLGVGRMSRQLIWSLMFGHNAGFATRLLNLPPGTIWEQMRLLLPILNEMACTMAYSVCWTLTFNQVRQEYADSHPNGPVWPGTFAAERARLRTGTTPIGTTPIGTTPIGTTPIGTTPIGTTPIGNVASARALVVGIWPLGSLNDQYWWGEVPTVLWALVGALSAWMLLVDMACLFRLVPFRDLVFSSVCHMAKEVWFLFAVLNSVTYSRVTLKKDIEQATVNLRIRTQVPFPPVIPGASWIQLLWRWLPSLLIIFKMVKNFSLISSVLLCRKYKRYNVPHPKYESFPGYPEILIHCDPTDLQDLPDATVRPTTARPTTARPTTARPTTARPTTADAVPTSSQDSLLKTSCLTEDAIFTRNANGSNDGSSVMPSPPLTAAADEGGGDDESGAADEGGDVNDESGVAEEAGNHDGAGAAEEAGNHDGAGAADEGGAADEDENGGEKEGEESGTKSKFGEPNSNKLSRDKATVQVASGRADEEGYIPVSSLLLYNLSVNFTGPVSLHSRVLEGKDLIKSLRLLDLIMTRQYTNIRLKALVALFLFFLYPAWTTAAAFSVSLSMMGIYWLVSHAMRLLTLRTLEVQDLLPKLISHYNQYTFTPNDRLFLSLSHVDENFRKHGLFSAPGRT